MVYGIFYTFPQSPLLAFHRIISDGWPKLQSFSLGLQKDPCTCFSDRNSSFVSIFHLLCVVRHFPSCVTPEEKASLLAYSHLLKGQLLSLCVRKRFHTFCLQHRGSPHGLFAWLIPSPLPGSLFFCGTNIFPSLS